MTERRPAHEPVPDFVERQIREAQARGDFDGLRGTGEPLPDLDRPHDELWWVRRKLRDEQITELPPALRIRRDRDRAVARALAATSEAEVRHVVAAINDRIREVNRTAWYGPPTSTGPIDVDELVDRWRRQQHPHGLAVADGHAVPAPDPPEPRRAAPRGLVGLLWWRLTAAARRRRARRRAR